MYYIRDAQEHEVDKIARVVERVLKEAPTYTEMSFDLDKTANLLADGILKRPGTFLRIIVDGSTNEPVGGMMCVCQESCFGSDKVAYDITVMVDKEHRGKCMKELVYIIEEYKVWAIEQGAKTIKMGVSSGINMDAASRFFERLGFTRIGAMHGFIVGG